MMYQNNVKALDMPLGKSLDKLQAPLILKNRGMQGRSQEIQ